MAVTRRIAVLFLLAICGVLAAIGTVVQALGGWPALAAYLVGVLALFAVLVRRARRLVAQRERAVRTCSCCTTSHADPVRMV